MLHLDMYWQSYGQLKLGLLLWGLCRMLGVGLYVLAVVRMCALLSCTCSTCDCQGQIYAGMLTSTGKSKIDFGKTIKL